MAALSVLLIRMLRGWTTYLDLAPQLIDLRESDTGYVSQVIERCERSMMVAILDDCL
jgi:hypothetical protein